MGRSHEDLMEHAKHVSLNRLELCMSVQQNKRVIMSIKSKQEAKDE